MKVKTNNVSRTLSWTVKCAETTERGTLWYALSEDKLYIRYHACPPQPHPTGGPTINNLYNWVYGVYRCIKVYREYNYHCRVCDWLFAVNNRGWKKLSSCYIQLFFWGYNRPLQGSPGFHGQSGFVAVATKPALEICINMPSLTGGILVP